MNFLTMKCTRYFLSLLGLLLSGCGTATTNLVPETVPQNASGIYTFSFSSRVYQPNVVPESRRAHLVGDVQAYPMQPDKSNPNIYRFDYQMPPNANRAKYYYTLSYNYALDNNLENRAKKYSDIYDLKLVNQYVLQLDSDRGSAGTRIGILGRNFSPGDTVYFGRDSVPTKFISSNSLSFQVPPVPLSNGKESYEIAIKTVQGKYVSAGRFYVDNAKISVFPEKGSILRVTSDRPRSAIFEISFPAPSGGLFVDVTTDIPNSVIMDEVIIPEGQRSTVVEIQAGSPGEGSLFVEADGFDLTEVPISVL